MTDVGPIGRLGRWTATHFRAVAVAWLVIALGLGVLAPRVEHALSGAGWEATGSESVDVRNAADSDLGGMSSSSADGRRHLRQRDRWRPRVQTGARPRRERSRRRRRGQPRSCRRERASHLARPPHRGRPGRRGATPTRWCAPPDDLEDELDAAGGDRVDVNLTGASAMWSDFNEANKTAMLKSELISWPVTMAILVLAFGSLVAAGLPLLLRSSGSSPRRAALPRAPSSSTSRSGR